MTNKSLSKLFARNPPLREALDGLLNAMGGGVGICDSVKVVLAGATPDPGQPAHPIIVDEEIWGWVTGSPSLAPLAALVALFARQEEEKKSLGAELIDRYREVNLLYHLSENLAVSPQLESIASVALAEAMRLSKARTGLILAVADGQAALPITAIQGYSYPSVSRGDLFERVIRTGKADIANDVPGGDYFLEDPGQVISLACAPLKADQQVQGLIVLVHKQGNSFTASAIKQLNTIAMQIAPLLEILRLYQLKVETARIERELMMARQVQESLLPSQMPQIAGWDFARLWHPAREVSGDFYDMIPEGSDQLGLVIGDVTDKGMPASLFMVFTRTALRASLNQINTPAEAIQATNHLICQDSFDSLFATLFYARLCPSSGELTYVNAGHHPPMFYRAQQDEVQLLRRTGLPLGIEIDSVYTERVIALQPGDFILFYTDGVTEATNLAQKEFGIERLQHAVYDLRGESTTAMLAGLEKTFNEFTDPDQSFDDITLMVVRRL